MSRLAKAMRIDPEETDMSKVIKMIQQEGKNPILIKGQDDTKSHYPLYFRRFGISSEFFLPALARD